MARAMKDLRYPLSDPDVRALFTHIDGKGRGLLTAADVVRVLRRPLEVRADALRTPHPYNTPHSHPYNTHKPPLTIRQTPS